jgi:hypothetical protein
MGVFAEWQPRYAEQKIATFPLDINGGRKKPATKGYGCVGLRGSEQLAIKFPEMDAFAFVAGRRSGITVVDIDAPGDEDLLRDTMRRYGDTPVVIQTGSGGFHLYYRHNGEDRKVRPDPTVPVDYLGGGMIAAAPSEGSRARYGFIRGGLNDLDRLPVASNLIQFPKPKLVREALPRAGLITEGRNNALFSHLMKLAQNCDDIEAVLDEAFTFANNLTDRTARHPFTDMEIRSTAKKVFEITARGDNRYGNAPTANIQRDTVLTHAARNPDAFALFSILQAHHKGLRAEFAISKAMADSLGWNLRKFRSARDYLVNAGLIKCVHLGGRGPRDPAKYRF